MGGGLPALLLPVIGVLLLLQRRAKQSGRPSGLRDPGRSISSPSPSWKAPITSFCCCARHAAMRLSRRPPPAQVVSFLSKPLKDGDLWAVAASKVSSNIVAG